jgi:hypothetical protein
MTNPQQIQSVIEQIRKTLGEEKKKIADIESLLKKKIERDVGLWEYSFDELEKELFQRVSSLDEKKENLFFPDVSSPRKGIGWLFSFLKKTIKRITRPYARMILAPQDQFNRDLIPFLLAVSLSLQKIKDRLNTVEGQIKDLFEIQKELSEKRFDLSKYGDRIEKGS